MAQVIQTLCDRHLHAEDGQHLLGTTFVINVNGRLRAIELCATCEQELLTPLQALLDDHGRKVEASQMPAAVREPVRVRDGVDRSIVCPLDQQVYKSRAGLAIHARHKHEMSVEALLGEAPNMGMMTCTFPDCGHRSVSRAALTTHAAARHQLTLGELEHTYGPLQPRLDVHNDGAIACPQCPDKVFKNRAGLGTHADKIHDMTVSMLLDEPNRVKCPYCPREYESDQAMADHTRKHDVHEDHESNGVEREGGDYICLDCDPPLRLTTGSGMSKHRRNKHKDRVAA